VKSGILIAYKAHTGLLELPICSIQQDENWEHAFFAILITPNVCKATAIAFAFALISAFSLSSASIFA
jgi:hypothetical protein